MKKTLLITGGAGFIGSNYVKYLFRKYEDIQIIILDALTYAGNLKTLKKELENPLCIFKKGDICCKEAVDELFKQYPIDGVVNFAAESHVDRSIENPQLFLITNILGTQNLLNSAKKSWTIGKDLSGYPIYKEGVKFFQISTDEVYGSLSESGYFTEQTPLDPRSPYSASKTGADLIVKAYFETYKMPTLITRCSNNYGPYHFPEKLIPLVIKNVLEGRKIPVYGEGKNVRDWLYVEDHCKAIDLVLNNGKAGEIYNIGGHNEKQNLEIVQLIIQTMRRIIEKNPQYEQAIQKRDEPYTQWMDNRLIQFVTDRLGHDMRYAIDPEKITTELGWKPETSFEEGIIKTITWYLENQDWVEEVTSGTYMQYYEEMYGNR